MEQVRYAVNAAGEKIKQVNFNFIMLLKKILVERKCRRLFEKD